MHAIELHSVSKRYRRPTQRALATTLKSYVLQDMWQRHFGAKKTDGDVEADDEIWALKDVSFAVRCGKTMGIIGRNGSGKSTLLKLLGGILAPDHGQMSVCGKVAALIELGAGFHPELTGRENILINGVILGQSKAEMRERTQEIINFAEIDQFIDYPVRTYSSGMYARLGFAVAIHVEPDILLIDEVLSVGDAIFTAKCQAALNTFKSKGKSIVVVSHDLTTISSWCDDAVWLDKGRLTQVGPARQITQAYQHAQKSPGQTSAAQRA